MHQVSKGLADILKETILINLANLPADYMDNDFIQELNDILNDKNVIDLAKWTDNDVIACVQYFTNNIFSASKIMEIMKDLYNDNK